MDKTTVPIWVTIIASLASGLVTFGISTWFYRRHEKRKQKFEVLRTLAANRHALTNTSDPEASSQFFAALNEAFVIFYDSKKVLEALNNFHKYPGRDRDNSVELFKAICQNLGINREFLDDEFFLTLFVPVRKASSPNNPLKPTL